MSGISHTFWGWWIWMLCIMVSREVALKCRQGLWSSEGAGEVVFKATHVTVSRRFQSLRRLRPLHRVTHVTQQLSSWRASNPREKTVQDRSLGHYNWISEVVRLSSFYHCIDHSDLLWHNVGGNYPRSWTPGGGDREDHLEVWIVQSSWDDKCFSLLECSTIMKDWWGWGWRGRGGLGHGGPVPLAKSLEIILLLIGNYCRGLEKWVIKLLFRMIMCVVSMYEGWSREQID